MIKTIVLGFGANKVIVQHAASGYSCKQGRLYNSFFSFPPFLQTAAGMGSTANKYAKWIVSLESCQLIKEQKYIYSLWAPALLITAGRRSQSFTQCI
jgi:hypothetical protein